MNREQQSTKKEQPTPLWRSNYIVKKDFILIPAFIIFQSIIPIIIVFGTLGVTAMLTQHAPPEWFYNLSLSFSFVLAQFLVLFFYFMPYINGMLWILHADNFILPKTCKSHRYCGDDCICANVTY